MPQTSLILHDTRLRGSYQFSGYQRVQRVNEYTSLRYAMYRVRYYAHRYGKLDSLGIACHGWEDTVEDQQGRQSITVGGFGLELCREGLGCWNVGLTRMIRDRIDKIIIYSCSAAESHPDPNHFSYIGDSADGQRLMAELAFNTRARVYAADATQYSDLMADGRYNLGRWYGNVYEFDPETGNSEIIQSYPRQ